MEKKAKLTIGIPVYNEEKYIAETLNSLVNQDFKDFKVIISDNLSTDNTWNIIQEFVAKDDRFNAIQHDKNKGLFCNWKFPLTKCDTEYFMWLGAHDTLESDHLSKTMTGFEKSDEIALSFTKVKCMDLDSNIIDESHQYFTNYNDNIDTTDTTSVITRWLRVFYNILSGSCIHGIFKTEVLRKIGLKKVYSLDILVLFSMAEYGSIHIREDYAGYKRRIVPPTRIDAGSEIDYTSKEFLKSLIDKGLIEPGTKHIFYQLARRYMDVVLASKKTSIHKKLYMIWITYYLHAKKRGLWNPIPYFFQ